MRNGYDSDLMTGDLQKAGNWQLKLARGATGDEMHATCHVLCVVWLCVDQGNGVSARNLERLAFRLLPLITYSQCT